MPQHTSTLRIIGGKWRSRKISFLSIKNLRPTTDATRETLFNWLAPIIHDANCLDLFAGSGALGFEALSRGARHVVMVDASAQVITMLKHNANLLKTANLDYYLARIPQNLNIIPNQLFDIVFLDPPFHHDLIKPTCERLQNSNYLVKNAAIYIEVEQELNLASLIPGTWKVLCKKITGQVGSYLLQNS